ncbi:hypothetical protein [Frigidibacter sp. ROC022]|uniref:hypothetical protein n=1 Tax=Frigidibacter sp. ROC022 TaxID=2971796 RepID=UPI00215AF34F|nr:hypothetical protein [Frigidibacter sp. ROC022]MCR8725730.1 hypothetical protein [Frigidibacter sp. ROC022]
MQDPSRSAPDPARTVARAPGARFGAGFWAIRLLLVPVVEDLALRVQAALPAGVWAPWLAATCGLGLAAWLRRRPGPTAFWLTLALLALAATLADLAALPAIRGAGAAAWLSFALIGSVLLIRQAGRTGGEASGFNWLAAFWLLAVGGLVDPGLGRPEVFEPLHVLLLFAFALAVLGFAHGALQLEAAPIFWIAFGLASPAGAALGWVVADAAEDGGLGLGPGATALLFGGLALLLVRAQALRAGPRR